MKKRLIAIVLVTFASFTTPAPCASTTPAPGASSTPTPNARANLRVAGASDLTFVMPELIKEFTKGKKDLSVQITYGASGTFHTQIIQNAPFDIFFSANEEYVDDLISRKLVESKERFKYAEGRIVLWVPKSSSINLGQLGMQALLSPQIRKIAIANPRHAPYGKAAEAAMKAAGVYDEIKNKLVVGENISQAVQFVQTKSAEIGILALGLAIAPELAPEGEFWLIPTTLYPKIVQQGAILKRAKNPEQAQEFRSYVLSSEGKRILVKYGFVTREPNQSGK